MTRTRVAAAAAAMLMVGGGLAVAAPASAQCVGPNAVVFGHGGGRCDHPPAPDGSFTRCDTVYVFGIGGTNCYQVPPGTP
ncbi:CDGP domain-containing protein [Mycobacterium sp. SMC-4]|uniref:CDGP domain-containing protein n=1 Tax=Mycobacterium sp. SMC-4 TaxID=2857059 RepID=UPI003D04808A